MKTLVLLSAMAIACTAHAATMAAEPPPGDTDMHAGDCRCNQSPPYEAGQEEMDIGQEYGESEVIVRSGPNDVDYDAYGPPPPFEQLDANEDDAIDEGEAKAYPPLANDFLYASGNEAVILPERYEWWSEDLR